MTAVEAGRALLVTAALAFLLAPSTPVLQALVPVGSTTLVLVAALAACAVLGWAAGGRIWLALLWVALAAGLVIWADPSTVVNAALARGWTLTLSASFGLVCVASTAGTRFLPRALTTLAATVAILGALALTSADSWAGVRRAVLADAHARPNAALEWVQSTARSPEWHRLTSEGEEGSSLAAAEEGLESVLAALPEDAVRFYPALLALESLAGLALAWGLYHRISRTRIGAPLGRLRDFRFTDQLAWGLIAGAVFVLLPTLSAWRQLGLNLLLFFGTLYALRGLGVTISFLEAVRASAPVVAVLTLFAALLSVPSAIALGLIGLGDSWMDWRSRWQAATSQSPG